MGVVRAFQNIGLHPASRWEHTEYGLDYHKNYLAARTGLSSASPELAARAYDRFGLDSLWRTDDGLIWWEQNGPEVSKRAGKPIRLPIQMRSAKLYAFQSVTHFDPEK
ncbi:MAG: hypothetical protein V1800_05930 [Candidatus Latescibacterota bacterium]